MAYRQTERVTRKLAARREAILAAALAALAKNGLRFTQFYNCGRCCPSRASLMTGLYPHQAGVGRMTNDAGRVGYHPVFPGKAGWASRRIEDDEDAEDVIVMLRLNYDRVVDRYGLPAVEDPVVERS